MKQFQIYMRIMGIAALIQSALRDKKVSKDELVAVAQELVSLAVFLGLKVPAEYQFVTNTDQLRSILDAVYELLD